MSRNSLGFLIPLAFLAACSSDAVDAENKKGLFTGTLKFSAIPNEDATMLRAKYDPVAKYLTENLGITVEYVPAADYQASVTMFENDDIQMAWFGGYTGVQARHQVPGSNAIVKGEKDANYRSYFIAPKGTQLQAGDTFPKAAEGKKFTFGSKSSTSGRLMPEFFIREETGKDPKVFFAEVGYSGSHTNTIKQVADGNWDLGVVDFGVYDGMVAEGKLKKADCPIIWTTPPYADYQFTVRPKLDAKYGDGFTKALTAALLGMDAKLANAFRREKMVEATNADFQGIHDVAKQLDMLR